MGTDVPGGHHPAVATAGQAASRTTEPVTDHPLAEHDEVDSTTVCVLNRDCLGGTVRPTRPPRTFHRLSAFIGIALILSACGMPEPVPTEAATSFVHRDVAGWSFYEASEQAGSPPTITVEDAVGVALGHLREQYSLSESVEAAEALYRRGLRSVEGYGAGAISMPRGDAWVLRFASPSGETRAWVVIGANGEVNASWYGY